MIATALLMLALQDPAWLGLAGSEAGFTATGGMAENLKLLYDAGGRPMVMYKKKTASGSSTGYVMMARCDGSTWSTMGPPSTSTGISGLDGAPVNAGNPVACIDHDGMPVVAWQAAGAATNIYLRCWNWQTALWEQLGTSGSGYGITGLTSGLATSPAVAIGADNRPTVFWQYAPTAATPSVICAAHWSGTAWVAIGSGSMSGAGISGNPGTAVTFPAAASNRRGDLVVVWLQPSPQTDYYARMWTAADGAWSDISSVVISTEYATSQDVAIDENGTAFVVWREGLTNSPGILLKRSRCVDGHWMGWTGLGSSATIPGLINAPLGTASTPCVAVDRSGRPVVAFQKNVGTSGGTTVYDIHVRRWDGGAWKGISGSDAGTGVSASTDVSANPTIAVSPYGTVGLAWRETTGSSINEGFYREAVYVGAEVDSLDQWKRDGSATIPAHGATGPELAFSIKATAEADTYGEQQVLEVEVQPTGSPFTNHPTKAGALGAALSLDVEGLAPGTRVHWQARVVNAFGATRGWIPFDGSPDDVDLIVRDNRSPAVAELAQFLPEGEVLIARGDNVFSRQKVQAAALVEDADDDDVVVEFEVRPAGEAFRGLATATGGWTAPGDASAVEVPISRGGIHWQARAVDPYFGASGWLAFGDGVSADLVFQSDGSLGGGVCDSSANGSAPVIATLLALLVVLLRR